MGSKLCPEIILEGTRLAFKTEIVFALNAHSRIVGLSRYRFARRLPRRGGALLPIALEVVA
jgi:hypothetical protein